MAPRSSEHLRTLLFDLRMIIAALFTVYGAVCLVYGLVDFTAEDSQRAGGINVNLWSGGGMLIAAACFVAWTLWRPLDPDETKSAGGERD